MYGAGEQDGNLLTKEQAEMLVFWTWDGHNVDWHCLWTDAEELMEIESHTINDKYPSLAIL
jgi:hypothetical protein